MLKSVLSDLLYGISYSVSYLLDNSVSKTILKKGIISRKVFAGLLRAIYLTQTDYRLVIDKREKLIRTKKGRIFAINHRQADDIVLGANAVGKSAYIVFGNKYLALETTNGLGLWVYGLMG